MQNAYVKGDFKHKGSLKKKQLPLTALYIMPCSTYWFDKDEHYKKLYKICCGKSLPRVPV
jgi:hypothetical protein